MMNNIAIIQMKMTTMIMTTKRKFMQKMNERNTETLPSTMARKGYVPKTVDIIYLNRK